MLVACRLAGLSALLAHLCGSDLQSRNGLYADPSCRASATSRPFLAVPLASRIRPVVLLFGTSGSQKHTALAGWLLGSRRSGTPPDAKALSPRPQHRSYVASRAAFPTCPIGDAS